MINLCELLKLRGFLTKEQLTQDYDFNVVSRQTDYYTNAAKYLGLIKIERDPANGKIGCLLTTKGEQIFNLNLIDRQKEFVKLIVSHSVFKQTLKRYFENGEMPSKEDIVDIMKQCRLYKVESDKTYFRRASTIAGWINWIMNQIEE